VIKKVKKVLAGELGIEWWQKRVKRVKGENRAGVTSYERNWGKEKIRGKNWPH